MAVALLGLTLAVMAMDGLDPPFGLFGVGEPFQRFPGTPFPRLVEFDLKSVSNPKVGDRVRVERDETIYPSKGTWPKFRGKTGTIVEVNLGEYGVVFTKVRKPRSNGSIAMAEAVWFQPHEVRVLAPALAPTAPQGATKQGCRAPCLSRKLADASIAYCRSGNGLLAIGQPPFYFTRPRQSGCSTRKADHRRGERDTDGQRSPGQPVESNETRAIPPGAADHRSSRAARSSIHCGGSLAVARSIGDLLLGVEFGTSTARKSFYLLGSRLRRRAPERRGAVVAKGVSCPPSAGARGVPQGGRFGRPAFRRC